MSNIKQQRGVAPQGVASKLRQITPRRLLNGVRSDLSLALRSSRVRHWPKSITIDIGNLCNLHCPLCPTGQGDKSVRRGFISVDNFKHIIDEISPYTGKLSLHNWGEPLLHPSLPELIRYAVQAGTQTQMSSNLVSLTPELAAAILDAGLHKFFVSCNAASAESYNQYHIGGNYAKVMSNLEMLVHLQQNTPGCNTQVIWLFHVFRHNEHEVETAKALATKLNVGLRISAMRTDMGKEIFESAETAIERDGAWIPQSPEFSAFDMDGKKAKKVQTFCKKPWREAVINWNGDVFPCCSVHGDKFSLGNVFSSSFREIWIGAAYNAARSEICNRKASHATVCTLCKKNGFLFM